MRSLFLIVGLVCALAGSAAAQVALDQWGTFAVTAYSDCADYCDPDVDLSWLLGLTFEPTNGGPEIDQQTLAVQKAVVATSRARSSASTRTRPPAAGSTERAPRCRATPTSAWWRTRST